MTVEKNGGVRQRSGGFTDAPKEKAWDDQLNAAIALIRAQLPDAVEEASGGRRERRRLPALIAQRRPQV
jgi:hypothetical protein